MKKFISILMICLLMNGCAGKTVTEVTLSETTATAETEVVETTAPAYASRFLKETAIHLSDDEITVEGNQESVTTSRDIVYYEDREVYDSGNPYGEGGDADKHTAEVAAVHTVVNIIQPGAYRVSGCLSAGQLRIDLGKDAYYDPDAVVELILDNADITCTVAPAILFQNVYECDGNWSVDAAKAEVDTTAAGANLILEGQNTVNGAYVAKIYKDAEGEKKLWKQDGAIYSYMSLNVFGPGTLELNAENEGLDTELHLTVNSGNLVIRSGNDGINTNEDGVSVTTINGGNLHITAGLGDEGDGIDSNGYLVINGGRVISSANPAADAGLDSDLGSYVNGGTVIAMGSTMDWAESNSGQVTMNLQFARQQSAGAKIVLTKEDGTEFFSFESDTEDARPFSGLILSHPALRVGETYHIYVDGEQMRYTGSQLEGGFGGRGGMGQRPEGEMPQMPEGMQPGQKPDMPENLDPSQMGGMEQRPRDGEDLERPENFGGQRPDMPEGKTMPRGEAATEDASAEFYMADQVNAFSGVTAG